MNRASFLSHLKMASAGVFVAPFSLFDDTPTLKKALLGNVGLQLFSAPVLLKENVEEGFELLQEMGYTFVETHGPYAFSSKTTRRYGDFKSGLYGNNPSGFKQQLGNLKVRSMHSDLDTLEQKLGAFSEAAQSLGAQYAVLPMIPDELRGDLEAYKKLADRFNAIGRACQKEGIRFAYHNHGFGFSPADDIVPFHYLMEQTDPNYVFLEMDIFWTTAAGQDPKSLLAQYPNRYKLMHIKDMIPNDLVLNEQEGFRSLYPFFRQVTSCGSGTIDIKPIVSKALDVGVEHFFVEHDMCRNPKVDLLDSAQFLLT